jgi:multidrug resistance efflux pump
MALLEAERSAAAGKLPNDNALAAAQMNNVTAEMQLAQQSVDYYQKVCDDTRRLVEQGAATKAEMDAAENKLREAKASLAAHAASSANSAPLAQNSARIGQIDQSLNSLQKISEEYFELKSAQGGKVGSVYVADGQSFAAGEPLAVLLNTEQVHIVTYVDPSDYKKITLGTVATVKILGTDRKIKAVAEEPPLLADNVPKGISEKVYPITMRGIQVFLKVMEPLQENEMIDGLPVEVSW